MNEIVAVVVTYNRKEKLINCIEALLAQKGGAPDILVVDNASTDGTPEAIAGYIEAGDVIYYNTGRNLGGAGGFEHGAREAVEMGYKYAWLMDDDCVPEKKALLEFKKLLDKKHPLELLSAIQTMLRKWIILKTKTASPAELSKLTGMDEFVVKQTLQKLKNTPISELVKLKENLFEVECKIKSAESVDMISEVECAIIR